MPGSSHDFTRLLDRATAGDPTAARELLPLIYMQLRACAAQMMAAERPDHTLQPTALVHEAYLRLVGQGDTTWETRAHFYVAAAESMRRILIEHGRKRGRQKRGGDWKRITLDSVNLAGKDTPIEEILSVDEAIQRIEERDERMARIVRLRFFAGLSVHETAALLGVTDRTVRREWALARAWLYRNLAEDR
ncbi:MAG: sigma-70 family RNA polymerase sigma factor [Candidatus Eisenbacteria sp.]|nr:sigma-70 family RNA polymerase sigma factor [Candidatus Eisenbacteria bacterium]